MVPIKQIAQALFSPSPAAVLPGRENPDQVTIALQHAHGGQAADPVAAHHVQHHVHRRGELAVQRLAWHAT